MSSLATQILKSSGLYSDEVLERIASQRAANPGMGLAEAAVKFGGVKELEFLTAIGGVLGIATYFVRPDVLPSPTWYGAIITGLASGLSAVGINQIPKQLRKDK